MAVVRRPCRKTNCGSAQCSVSWTRVTALRGGTHSKEENTADMSLEKHREVMVATCDRLKRGLRPGMASVTRRRSIAAPPTRFKAKYAR